MRDVGKAAKDWPQLNFVIYHSAFRFTGGAQGDGWAQFEQTGRVDWVTDLAEIPAKYGVTNVYGDLGPDLRAEHGRRSRASARR